VLVDLASAPSIARVAGRTARVRSDALEVSVLAGTGGIDVPRTDGVESWTVVDGRVRLVGAGFDLSIPRGRSAVVPASVGALRCEAEGAHVVVASAT
jgi:mannose-6-phosphate isomerase class I